MCVWGGHHVKEILSVLFLFWKKCHFSLQNTSHLKLHINLTKHHHTSIKKHLASFQRALSVMGNNL